MNELVTFSGAKKYPGGTPVLEEGQWLCCSEKE